jgi:hypothetical protein
MAYTDISTAVLSSTIGQSMQCIAYISGIFTIQSFHDEMNLGIPQPGKDVVLTPRSIWSDVFM